MQIIAALKYLHSHRIIHRDLKPENVLCHKNVYKISDFGLSVEKEYFSSDLGSIRYLAPEYNDELKKGKSVDIWAFGIILFELLFQIHPFTDGKKGNIAIMKSAAEDPLIIQSTSPITADCRDLITRCLEKDPQKRIKIAEVRNHLWFAASNSASKQPA